MSPGSRQYGLVQKHHDQEIIRYDLPVLYMSCGRMTRSTTDTTNHDGHNVICLSVTNMIFPGAET
jgi:hypothetical protein